MSGGSPARGEGRAIPVYRPSLLGREKEYVNECLDSTWISSKGRFLPLFEEAFAGYTGVRYASGVPNGTVALHLALVALGIGPGDEVIVPTLTYVSSVNAVVYTGAKPVFVDSLPDTWQMDVEDAGRKVTPATRAMIAVHLYGHPCDMGPLMSLADERSLFVVEDCAEAFGSRYGGRHVGSFGHIGTYSFFGNKTITTGEGGMVVTDDETLHERVEHFKGQGLARHREYWHDVVGYNYRMTNICAAIGLAQLERADQLIAAKRNLAERYIEKLEGLPVRVHPEVGDVYHSYWMVSILTDEPARRDPLRRSLAEGGIETRPLFPPVHTMPMYAGRFERHRVAEDLGWRGISLPSWPDLPPQDVDYVCERISSFYREGGR